MEHNHSICVSRLYPDFHDNFYLNFHTVELYILDKRN